MSTFSQHFGQPVFPGYWREKAVSGLDRLLRRRQGVFEYSDSPDCFEPAADTVRLGYRRSSSSHDFGENILIFLLVLATNPVAAGPPILRRDHKLVYLSRAALECRNGRAWTERDEARSPRAC
ncbi:MAG: hypothetical protein WCA36_10100 [Pseudolabrys sp.]